jgi:hypothetical protein
MACIKINGNVDYTLEHTCILYKVSQFDKVVLPWGPIFADGQSSKCLQFKFRRHIRSYHYTLYNHTYFAGLIFADSCLSAKIEPTKISRYTVSLHIVRFLIATLHGIAQHKIITWAAY